MLLVPASISTVQAQDSEIPSWIKNNAGWWATDLIDDSSFLQGIQYLIKEGIMVIPPTETSGSSGSEGVPAWIKNNAGWWADGQIDDGSFVSGIQWLISNGIIVVEQEESAPTRSSVTIIDQADYTVLVYMVGSDLESGEGYAATWDLMEMATVGPSSSVNVIVQTGGADAKPDEYRFLDFTTVQRLNILGNDEYEILDDLGRKNMGKPSTLSDFIVWGTQEFPAEKYVLILWDHGGGIHGFGNDEMYDMDGTDLDEFAVALSSAYQETGVIFEVIGFDQCLMATIEVAAVIENYANYMVASEEIEPGDGWDYTAIISSLHNNPNQDGKSLGKVIADSYVQHTKYWDDYWGTNSHRLITLSVVDLSKIDSLVNAWGQLDNSLDQEINTGNGYYYSQALTNSERYAIDVRAKTDSGHTDIKDVVTNISHYLPAVKSEADNVKALVSEAVVYNVHGVSKPNANGLSIHIPLTDNYHPAPVTEFQQLADVSDDYQDYLTDDTVFPTLEYEVVDGIVYGNFGGDDVYSFKLFITSLDFVLNEGSTEILAIEEYDPNDFPGGDFETDWDGYLPAFCDESLGYVSCMPINSEVYYNDGMVLEYIPAILEGPNVDGYDNDGNGYPDVDVDLIYDITDWENPIFLGALPYNEDGYTVARDLWPVNIGDYIFTYTADYNFNTGESVLEYYEDPIIVDDYFLSHGPMLGLMNGTFELIFEVCDFSGNCIISEPIGPYIPLEPIED